MEDFVNLNKSGGIINLSSLWSLLFWNSLITVSLRGYPLSTYPIFSEKLSISNPLIRTRTCAYQRFRNVSFSEDIAYVLNGWVLKRNGQSVFLIFSFIRGISSSKFDEIGSSTANIGPLSRGRPHQPDVTTVSFLVSTRRSPEVL